MTLLPTRLLAAEQGDVTFAEILPRLRRQRCKQKPAPACLCAGHRTHCYGGAPDCAIELMPARER